MYLRECSQFPLTISTHAFPLSVNQGLYQKALQLAFPTSPTTDKPYVLIYGGSSATGSLAIQFARLSGYRVLTTCSPRNNDFVLSLGAEKTFDYRSPTCGADINAYTSNSLLYAWDTISLPDSAAICAAALASPAPAGKELKYGSILPVKTPGGREDIQVVGTLMYTIFNEPFTKGGKETPASPEDFESAKRVFELTEKLLAEGKLKPHPEAVGEGGLRGVLKGMKDLQEDKVSGQKLVYRVEETEGGKEESVSFE